jgi:hypothetical protein
MQDTDWRPSPCPRCGVMREATQYPVCENKQCNYFGYRGDSAEKQTERTMKKEQKYILIRPGSSPTILHANELESVYKDIRYNADTDQIFELGPEVKIKMQIVTIPAGPVTRTHSWENKE